MKDYIKRVLNTLLYTISYVIPKTNKIVICGGWFGERFADNSKAFYLYLMRNKKMLNIEKVIYVCNDEKLYSELKSNNMVVYKTNSILSIWYHLRANYIIVDQGSGDINKYFSHRCMKINLWHGFPLKRIQALCFEKDSIELETTAKMKLKNKVGYWENQFLLSMSNKHTELMKAAFMCNQDHIILGTYPRILYLMNEIERVYLGDEKEIYEKILSLKQTKQIVFYLPTFRDDDEKNNICANMPSELNECLRNENMVLLTKMHYATKVKIGSSENIINLPKDFDVYNFLDLTDILITDYSSVAFDYLILNKPIIYYAFDLEYYENIDRGLLFDFDKFSYGEICMNISDLLLGLSNIIKNKNEYEFKFKTARDYMKKIIYDNHDAEIGDMKDLWKKILRLRSVHI